MNTASVNDRIRYKASEFRQRNTLARPNGSAFFGADALAAFPVTELAQNLQIEKVYNRSIPGLSIKAAVEILDDCLLDLAPEKIFLCFGDEEQRAHLSAKEFAEDYRWLLYQLHNRYAARLYIIFPFGETTAYREALTELCKETGCTGIDTADLHEPDLHLRLFDRLRFHLRGRLSFAQAINF